MKTDCCQQSQFLSPTGCGCCEGVEPLTPMPTANRPGLASLTYRIGTHATFLETMKARLSSSRYPELSGLAIRQADDPALALLDAWATVGDVLTFYQERIANEGYLRTATERRSVLELAQLVGYALRPGVAATVYLAYTVEENTNGEVLIPKGSRVQSVPDPGEFPQTFETREDLVARADWSALKPRLKRPQYVSQNNSTSIETLYLKGAISAKANDRLLLVFGEGDGNQISRRVASVETQFVDGRTKVMLQLPDKAEESKQENPLSMSIVDVVGLITQPPPILPSSQAYLVRSIPKLFGPRSDVNAKLLTAYQPVQKEMFYKVFETLPVTTASELKNVQVMAIKAGVYGRTAPLKPVFGENGAMVGSEEWPLAGITLSVAFEVRQLVFLVSVTDDEGVHSGSVEPTEDEKTVTLGSQKQYSVACAFKSSEYWFSFVFNQGDTELETIVISLEKAALEGELFNIEELRKWLLSAALAETAFGIRFELKELGVEETLTPGHRLRRSGVANHKKYRVVLSVDRTTYEPSAALELMIPPPANAPIRQRIVLDGQYDQIAPGSWVIVERPGRSKSQTIAKVETVETVSKTDYNMLSTATQLTLDKEWLDEEDLMLSDIRDTVIYAQNDTVQLAEEPVTGDIAGDLLELERLVDGLDPGRWLIVCGERTDLEGATGIRSAELAMLASVTHDVAKSPDNTDLPGDKTHSWLRLNNKLANKYKRDTVIICANVVKATHGETRREVLGSGNGGKALQVFALKSTPLTYVAAPTPSGAESTLEVRVNDILWHETDTLAGLTPTDRCFVTNTDDEGKTTVQFGNGLSGARLPTGSENVTAVYRNGIGKAGNVRAGQLSLLMTKPSGVKDVTNPRPASGGADKETRDSARRSAPLRVMALDRLVSVSDYADFARSFAGIGKASAIRLYDRRRETVHLTIAGSDDIPIDESSDLYQNLVKGLRQFGDPVLPFLVAKRELLLILIKARVKVKPDYLWSSVEAKVRSALLNALSFDRRALGQDVLLSEVIANIQAVSGVAYVDMDEFDAVGEAKLNDFLDPSVNEDAKEFCSPFSVY